MRQRKLYTRPWANSPLPPTVSRTFIQWRMAMKALVKSEAGPGLWLKDVPQPEIGINDLLIRVLRTGICGTDLHIYDWDAWAQRTIPVPLVIGHEFVGQVVEVGSNVNDFHPGDIVSEIGRASCRERV